MKNTRVKIQAFGGFLTAMILPNIGAFIAWGLITAMFIPAGWLPNKYFALLKTPMINYLLPLLIGYTGGDLVYGKRGAVVGAVVTMGSVVGANIPMFAGAMVLGPFGGYIIKKFDQLFKDKIPSGFEMLFNNFSAGIIGMLLCLISYSIVGPLFQTLNSFFSSGINWLLSHNLMILYPIFMEPARMLFLNNAISQGIFAPLGVAQAAKAGKSIFFLVSSNPGPGLGLLIAYWLFGKGTAKEAAPSAMIIHFFGGIHEMYFPYIFMKPKLIIATIAGWMVALPVYTLFNAGLVAYPSPGSVISIMLMSPRGMYLVNLSGIVAAAIVSFLIASFILKMDKSEEGVFQDSIGMMEHFKGKESKYFNDVKERSNVNTVKKIVFACDAGMGSSAMGASVLKKKIRDAKLNIEVTNTSIEKIPADADIIVCHEGLYERAKKASPNGNFVVITNFVAAPEYDKLVSDLKAKAQ
ncbi:MAG TPA: PTS mannitol transporter subunit IIBC [Clostridiaceae bacterium]|jgi:PTS system mannitol-specific IIC component|nr:PTS mannitol transporter subunit IIBC [Clostridiaceae bacterium]